MKKIAVLLCLLIMTIGQLLPAFAVPQMDNMFTIIVSSPDLAMYFDVYKKYKKDVFIKLNKWDDLDNELRVASLKVPAGQKVYIDFMVHGNSSGLYVRPDYPMLYDRASFGYVLHKVEKNFNTKNMILTFESCMAGDAYKNSIRGAQREGFLGVFDNIEDYNGIPKYPVYATGQGFSVVGPVMYLQVRYHFKKYWKDLRDFDKKGRNEKLSPEEVEGEEGYSPTTENMVTMWRFFADHIPY